MAHQPILSRDILFAIIVGICVVNGIFSPAVPFAQNIPVALMPELFPRSVGWILFFSSVTVSTATLLVSGVPAALFERFALCDPASSASMWVWLSGAMLLSFPALKNIGLVM
jgi:hypothetical protein